MSVVEQQLKTMEPFFTAAEKRLGLSVAQKHRIVFINGRFSQQHSQWEPLPQFQLEPLSDGGVHLRLSSGRMDLLHLLFVHAPNPSSVEWRVNNTIELDGGYQHLVEQHISESDTQSSGTIANTISVGRGHLRYTRMQAASFNATLNQRNDFSLAQDAQLNFHDLDIGAGSALHELNIKLAGARAGCVAHGVFALQGRQRNETRIAIEHQARDTASEVLWRGVANGRSHGLFHGAIAIAAGADGSQAQLSNKNLLLSAHAEIDTKPMLEIHTDDVKASHGATVGQLDEHSLFYLRARGMPLEQARRLLTEAFCRAALEGVPEREVREPLMQQLLVHLSPR